MATGAPPFRADDNALIRFGDAGGAPVLSFDVPQPAEYDGRFHLELLLDPKVWAEAALPKPPPPSSRAGSRPRRRRVRHGPGRSASTT